jgi:hypothetical protein
MKRAEYETTADYRRALQVMREFVGEVLGGEIDQMRRFCFGDLTNAKFIGDIKDPDMYLVVQGVYIILCGDVYDLTFDNMGSWDEAGTYAFRGDTMNSFTSYFGGKEIEEASFGYRAKFFGADKKPELWRKIEEFHKIYHWLGNFIVIPNRGSARNGINGARGMFFGMRDYFDWFLLAVAEYQDKVKSGAGGDDNLSSFEKLLKENGNYEPYFLEIGAWENRFFLKHYFKDGRPGLLFKTPLERRVLKTAAPENRVGEGYYQDEEYMELLEDYLDKSKAVIEYRTNKMVDCLKEKLQ